MTIASKILIESGIGNDAGNSKHVQVLRRQLDRLDPAHKCLKIQGFADANLAGRVARIQEIVTGIPGFPSVVSCETIHKGKRDARVPTHMTLVEFQSNRDREKEFVLLEGKSMTDTSGAALVSKRAQTEMQRERNMKLQKAEEEIKKKTSETVKIEWKERQVLCKDVPAFIQNKDDSGGKFFAPFLELHV